MAAMQNITNEPLERINATRIGLSSDSEEPRSRALVLWTLAAVLAAYFLQSIVQNSKTVKAPYVGFRSWFEPKLLVGLRFATGALSQVTEGYEKYKQGLLENGMFKIVRNDSEILVISNKYVEELRSLPDAKLSAIRAHIKNLLGKYSTTNILLESDLHTKMLQTKLTPNLGSFIGVIESELEFALDVELPKDTEDWKTVSMYELLLRIVARISARVFLGLPHCRNEEWLHTSIKYTENVFMTVMLLRAMPKIFHPIAAQLLPSYWRVHANLNTAKRIIGPIVKDRRAKQLANDPDYQKPNDMLQWMMDAANENDGQPDKLAHRQLLLSLASIHTTTMSAAHAFYDLCARPEYFEPLRREAFNVLDEDGGWGKTTLNKMRKLDSFLKESQRVNPPSLLAFNRIVREPLTLSDGHRIPANTHFAMPAASILQDPSVLPDADSFDGFRSFKKRENAAESNKHQFAMTDSDNLHFGHGKYSCPGRFFASNEIKMVMAQLLMRFEFKYPPGQSRPVNLTADENLYPDPSARLMMRQQGTRGDAPTQVSVEGAPPVRTEAA